MFLDEDDAVITIGQLNALLEIIDEQAQQIADLEAWRESVKGQLLEDKRIRG